MSIFRYVVFSLFPVALLTACGGDGDTSGGGNGGSATNGGGGAVSSTGGSGGTATMTGGGGAGGATTMTGGGGAGGATTTTMTGGGGAGGMGMDACINDTDEAVLTDPSKDIPQEVNDCAQSNFGMEPATYDCIKMLGLTDGCAQCFDDTVQCVVANCLQQCIGGDGPECTACRAEKCDPAFAACSGLTP